MALSFTQILRMSLGGKAFRAYQVTTDASTTAVTAANLDMNYVEAAMVCPYTCAASVDTEIGATVSGGAIDLDNADAASTGTVINLWAIGF